MTKKEAPVKLSKSGKVSVPGTKFGGPQTPHNAGVGRGPQSANFVKPRTGTRGDK